MVGVAGVQAWRWLRSLVGHGGQELSEGYPLPHPAWLNELLVPTNGDPTQLLL